MSAVEMSRQRLEYSAAALRAVITRQVAAEESQITGSLTEDRRE